jgi:enamine deaminase RidA (YjgF/YER057c/UK114 family)
MSSWEARVTELGLVIPDPLPSAALYRSVVVDGTLAFTSGIVAVEGPPLRLVWAGCVGEDLSLEDGQKSARGALMSTLGNLRGELGTLDRIDRFLKMTGFVRTTPGFNQMPKVMDGASELLIQIFGEGLLSARTAIGVTSLPGGASVEIDTIVRLRD